MSDIGHTLIIGDSQCKYFDSHVHLLGEGTTVICRLGVDNDMLEACEFYDHVVLHVGTHNMVDESPASACAKYERLISSLRQMYPDVIIFISGVIPRAVSFLPDLKKKSKVEIIEMNEKAQELHLSLKQLCIKYESCYYLDSWDKFKVRRKLLAGDGLHLSKSGIKTILHNINEALETYYSSRKPVLCSADCDQLLPDSNAVTNSIPLQSLPKKSISSSSRFKSSVPTFFKTVLPKYRNGKSKSTVTMAPASLPETSFAIPISNAPTSYSYSDAILRAKLSETSFPCLPNNTFNAKLCERSFPCLPNNTFNAPPKICQNIPFIQYKEQVQEKKPLTSSCFTSSIPTKTTSQLASNFSQKPIKILFPISQDNFPLIKPTNEFHRKKQIATLSRSPPVSAKTPLQIITKPIQKPSNPTASGKNQFSKLNSLSNGAINSSQSFPKRTKAVHISSVIPSVTAKISSPVVTKPIQKPSNPTASGKNQFSKLNSLSNGAINSSQSFPKRTKAVHISSVIPSVTAKISPQVITKPIQKPSNTISFKKNQFSKLYLLPDAFITSTQSFSNSAKRVSGKSCIKAMVNTSPRRITSRFSNGLQQDKFRVIGGGEEANDDLDVDEPSSGEEYFKPKKSKNNSNKGRLPNLNDFVQIETKNLNTKKYKCKSCGKIYKRKSTYYEHIKFCNKYSCEVVCKRCKVCYKNALTYSKHFKHCNPRSTRYTQCVFPGCHDKFYTRCQMVDHLENKHEEDTGVERFMFDNFEQLNEWKKKEDKGKFMSTVKRAGTTTRGEVTYHYYTCNFDVKKRKNRGPGRILNYRCPARILVREENKKLQVKYISGHSHDLEVKNLKFHQHSKETLTNIRAKFSEGIPPHKILEQMHGPDDGVEKFPEKDHLIPLKTINDLFYRYNRSTRLHKDDAKSVAMLVDMLNEKGEILIYKPQDEKTVVGPKGIDDLEDSSSLFILGYQNERMRKEMLAGSSKVLCVDATHNTNKYGFSLVNLVVPDEYGVGYPVAHFITSSMKEGPTRFIFESIKEKLPNLKTNVLMTDDDKVTWPAYHEVFGGDTVHYLCTWHVERALKNQLNSQVSDAQLRKEIENDYRALIEEKDTNLFRCMLKNFTEKYSDLREFRKSKDNSSEGVVRDQKDNSGSKDGASEKDTKDQKDTGSSKDSISEIEKKERERAIKEKKEMKDAEEAKKYIEYFTSYYALRPEKWAKCFRLRPYANTDTNMYCEAFHSTLKGRLYLNRKVNGRLDTLLEALRRFEFRKSVDLKRKRFYQEPPLGLKKPDDIESRHTRGVKIPDDKVREIAKDQWQVTSSKDDKDYYEVNLFNEYCPLADHCDQKCYAKSCILLCMHLYVCECPDRHPLCKHKHKVHSLRVRKDPILSDIKVEEEPATWKIRVNPEPTTKYPPILDPKPEKMVSDLNFLTDKLKIYFNEKPVLDKFYPRLKNVLQQLICECEYAAKEGKKKADPPPMKHDKIPPNKKAEKQKVVYRTTKERKKQKKTFTPRLSQQAKISVRNDLLHLNTEKSTDELMNRYPHDYHELHKTLFSIDGINVNLLDLKTVDDRLTKDEVAALQLITTSSQNGRGFNFGWLSDSVIDAFSAILKRRYHPSILHLNVFVTQFLMRQVRNISESQRDTFILSRLDWLKIGQQMIFMPANISGNHWVLVVTDTINKKIMFLDSDRPKEPFRDPTRFESPLNIHNNGNLERKVFKRDCYQYFFNNWRMVLESKTRIRPEEWELIVPQHSTQQDSYNCGVFVCFFYERLLAGQSINVEFSCHDFRMHILRELIREGNPQEPINLTLPEPI